MGLLFPVWIEGCNKKKKVQSVYLDSGQSIDFSCLNENKEDNY